MRWLGRATGHIKAAWPMRGTVNSRQAYFMRKTTYSMVQLATGSTLLGASAIHVAWGRGSTFPYGSAAELTDNVVGSSRPPTPTACYSVAFALAMAAALVTTPRGRLHRGALGAMSGVFASRAAFGFAGRTDLLVPGSNSNAFRRLDRMVFSPLCALLAIGIASSRRGANPT